MNHVRKEIQPEKSAPFWTGPVSMRRFAIATG